MTRSKLLRSLVARERADRRATFSAERLCFGPQLAFVRDTSRLRVACTTRRAGKTTASSIALLETALANPGCMVGYAAMTRIMADDLVWQPLKRLNATYALNGITNDTKLTLRLPNGSVIRCGGAQNKKDADKWRGISKVKLFILDEAQSWAGATIEYFVNEILTPTLIDVAGSIAVTGTPGPLPQGYFYDLVHSPDVSRHSWSLRDNPHLGEDVDVFLGRIRRERGISELDPGYQREFLNRWVIDTESLVYKYAEALNDYQDLPAGKWHYVIGVDFGFEDADAIAVLGWTDASPNLYLVEEDVGNHQSTTEVINRVRALSERYRPRAIVGDPGGGGKRIIEDLRREHGMYIEAAEKTKKIDHIMLLNDWLRTGRLKIKAASHCAQDYRRIEWHPEYRGVRVSDAFHSDIADAVLYAARRARHYLYQEPTKPTQEPLEAIEKRALAREAQDAIEARKRPWYREMRGRGSLLD